MKVKNIFVSSIILVAICLFVTSCKKYEEGPRISLKSAKNRITGNWQFSFTKINGVLVNPTKSEWLTPTLDTALILSFNLDINMVVIQSGTAMFEEDGDGKFEFVVLVQNSPFVQTEYFSWSLDTDKKNILMNYKGENIVLEIRRLNKNEMNVQRTHTGDGTITTTDIEFLKIDDDENSD